MSSHPTYCLSGHIVPLWEQCSGVVRVGQEKFQHQCFCCPSEQGSTSNLYLRFLLVLPGFSLTSPEKKKKKQKMSNEATWTLLLVCSQQCWG